MAQGTASASGMVRGPAVAGAFYPGDPLALQRLVDGLLEASAPSGPGVPALSVAGLLVPHAGLAYSGTVAAAAWRLLRDDPTSPRGPVSVVILGTNHGAGWLDGIGIWEGDAWRIPTGIVATDVALTAAISGLGPPFGADRAAHASEHSIEVQLPLLQAADPAARVVPLAVSCGTGDEAIRAGTRLGSLLAAWQGPGRVVLAISTDMAHYPGQADCAAVTRALLDPIVRCDAAGLADRERAIRQAGIPGLLCGMCGIEPAVVGLAALRTMGTGPGSVLARATSADAGGPPDRVVGYLAVAYPG